MLRHASARALASGIALAAFVACDNHAPPAPESPPVPTAPSAPVASAVTPASPDASATLTPDAGPPPDAGLSLQQRATACLEDPVCPAAEADRLFRAADDAHEGDIDCLRFADGDGTKRDLRHARSCLERTTVGAKCDGDSAGLWQAELAIDRIDGVGGPQDLPGARKLLDGCFDDVTKQLVLAHADAREADAGTPSVDFCKDYGGTTLTSNECGARVRQREATRGALQAKIAVAGLDEQGRSLFAVASSAYARYIDAMGSYVYEVFKDGTIRNAQALAEENALLARRTAALAKLPSFAPLAPKSGAVERSSRGTDAALKTCSAGAGTPEVQAKIAEAQAAWAAYRDAEIALYVHAFGADAGPDVARDALLVTLNEQRTADLAK